MPVWYRTDQVIARSIAGLAMRVMLAGALGAGTASAAVPSGLDQSSEEFYRRATAVFETATLHKPYPAPSQSLASTLVPLIIRETAEREPPGKESSAFPAAAVHQSAAADGSAIYSHEGEILIDGQRYPQATFLWFYATEEKRAGAPEIQGVRITLNTAGQPVIWEALSDVQPIRLLFVAESLEQAAAEHFGAPLPGRRYAVEPGQAEQPDVVVARVIDDGPVPMGPMVYLESRPASLTAVLCRCMPAQVKNILVGPSYELLPVDLVLDATPASDGAAVRLKEGVRRMLDSSARQNQLGSRLRLPPGF